MRSSIGSSSGHRMGVRGVVLAMGVLLAACASGTQASDDPAGDEETSTDEAGDVTELPETTLRVQSANGPGTAPSRAFDAWKEAVEEASGGRLNFEMFYSGSLVPLSEVEEGLASGLVDIASHVPAYSPAQFPYDNTVQQLNSLVTPTPIGTLQGIGAQTEFALEGVAGGELEELGLRPLLVPAATISSMQLVCAGDPVRSLAEAEGVRVRVPSEHHGTEATALGMTPTATTNAELFEAVERGVVDCSIMSPQDVRDLGLVDVIDHWILDPDVMFSGFSSFHVSMSQASWDALPVEAQRLLWDTAGEVFLPTITAGYLADAAATVEQASEAGVEFHEWDDDARTTLRDHQASVIDTVRDEVGDGGLDVDRFAELHEEWGRALSDLGYGDELASFQSLAGMTEDDIDLTPFMTRVNEIRAAHRP